MNESVLDTLETSVRPESAPDSDVVPRIVEKHRGARGAVISVLEEIQVEYGYLPEFALRTVAKEMNLSLVDLYGVATFYRAFSLQPRGRHLISVCLGTACHVRGAPMVVEEFQRQLGISIGETTPDKEFTLETVNCLGACALGPIVALDGHYFPNVNTSKVKGILKTAERRSPEIERSHTGTLG
ncbi:MAG: NAD(P)H-dependent oxidoreductase subunit E [bacterium]